MAGTDYTLYLVYLRYAAWISLMLTVVNLLVIIPMYGSGNSADTDNWRANNQSSMNNFTLLNITASPNKFAFIYLFTMLFVSGMAYCMVIMY
jgi:membrane-associated protease RseP (regulator of RpoE activity)